MSKKSGLICLGLGLVAGYAICKYGESVSNSIKAKLEKKSVEDLADEIKDTLATGKDDFAEYLRDLKKRTCGCEEEVEEEKEAVEPTSIVEEKEEPLLEETLTQPKRVNVKKSYEMYIRSGDDQLKENYSIFSYFLSLLDFNYQQTIH